MNRIINNNKYKKIDWRMVGRVIVVILATFLINKFTLDKKDILRGIAITTVILNAYCFCKIKTIKETRFSKALKGSRALYRVLKTNFASFTFALFSFIYSFNPTMLSEEKYKFSKMLLIVSLGFLVWLLVDTDQIIKYNRRSG